MDKNLRINIDINPETAKLDALNSKINTTSKGFNQADSMASDFLSRLSFGAGAVGGLYLVSNVLNDIARTGFETNRTMQNLTNSLTTLRAVSASNVDSMGNQLTIQQKYNMAQVEGKEALQELIKINAQTPHSLNETAKIYDAMYLGMKKVGASSEDMIDITKKISIAAGNRMNFDALLSAMDGLSTGTVETASDMGRFLKSIGLSNEAIKSSSNVIQLFKDKLSGFQAIDSFDTRISNLNNSFATLSGTLTKPFFDSFSKSMIPATELLNNLNIKLEDYYNNINKVQDIHKQNNVVTLKDELGELEKKLDSAKESSKRFYNEWTTHDEAEINKLELLIKTTKNKIKDLENPNKPKLVDAQTTRDDISIIKIMGTEYQKLNLDIDDNVKKLKEAGATQGEIDKFRATSIKDFNDKQSKANQKTFKEQEKNLETLSQAYSETAQIGMSDYNKSLISIADKVAAWTKAGVDNIEILRVQGILLDELNQKQALETTKTDLSYYERKVQLQTQSYEKELELQGISYGQKVLDIEGSSGESAEKERLIELEAELYNATVARMELDRNTEFQETITGFYDDMLESQLSLNSALYDFGDGFGEVGNKIAAVSKSLATMQNADLKSKKELAKLDDKYAKEFKKYSKDKIKTKELTIAYEQEEQQLKEQILMNQIGGLSEFAGQSKQFFGEQTTAYKTLHAIEAFGHAARMAAMAAELPGQISSLATNIANALAAQGQVPIIGFALVAGMAALLAGLGVFSGGGGGGGASGGGGSKKPSQFDIREQELEDLYTPMTDRIDRTNELLESIDKQGSASAVSLVGAKISFEKDYALAVNEINKKLPTDVRGYGLDFNQHLAPIEASLGFNIADVIRINKAGWDKSEKRIYTDFASLNSGNNMIKLISAYFEDTSKNSPIAALFGGHNALNLAANEIQKTIGDFTSGIVDSLDDLKDASSDFKEHYDSITGSMYYENKKLADAFNDVKALTNGKTFAEYLKQNIDEIDTLSNTFSDAVVNTLLSQDPKDMEKQIKVLEDLQAQTGLVFQGGAKDALDFLESIDLVAQAMATSSSNVKDFTDGFKTELEIVKENAKTLGIKSLATDLTSLNTLFISLKSDTLGLVDAELELLNANRSLIDSYNNIISDIDNILSPKTLSLGAVKVEDVTLDTASDFLEQLSNAKQAEIDRITQEANAKKQELEERQKTAKEEQQAAETIKKAFENTTKSLYATYKNIIGQTSLADSFNIAQYQKLYKEIGLGIQAGTDISELTNDFNTYATSYSTYIKNTAQTQEEYNRKMKILANEVKGLAGRSETASLNDLNNKLINSNTLLSSIGTQIVSLNTDLQSKIDSINATYISQTKLLKDTLTDVFTQKTISNYTPSSSNIASKSYTNLIEDAFNTVLGEGILAKFGVTDYWLEQLNSGRVATQDLYKAVANSALEFDINGYLASTNDYSIKTIAMISDALENAQKYLSDNLSQTTTSQNTNYYVQKNSDKNLDEVVKELQRLNTISAANAENIKDLLKTNKQTLVSNLQGAQI